VATRYYKDLLNYLGRARPRNCFDILLLEKDKSAEGRTRDEDLVKQQAAWEMLFILLKSMTL